MIRAVESGDDVDVPETEAPTVFAREHLDFMTFEETGITHAELPQPTLWRVLVMPKQPKTKSKGGIVIPVQAQDVEQHLNYIGQVVAMGPLAGKSEKFLNPQWADWHAELLALNNIEHATVFAASHPEPTPQHLWNVKVGDWVIYGKYSGMNKMFKEVRFLTLNDDDITDVISSPDGFKVYL